MQEIFIYYLSLVVCTKRNMIYMYLICGLHLQVSFIIFTDCQQYDRCTLENPTSKDFIQTPLHVCIPIPYTQRFKVLKCYTHFIKVYIN